MFFWNCILYVIKLGKALALDKIFSIKLLAFVKEFLKSFVQKGAMWQFWYLGALLIIYLLLPFLSKLNQHSKRVVLLICGIISIAIQIASFQCGKPMQKYVTDVSYMDMAVLFSARCRNEDIKSLDFQSHKCSISSSIMYGDYNINYCI